MKIGTIDIAVTAVNQMGDIALKCPSEIPKNVKDTRRSDLKNDGLERSAGAIENSRIALD